MAERTKEHEELIEEAKKLGVQSPHLFGLDKLKERVEEAKRVNHDDAGSGEDDAGTGSPSDSSDKPSSPIADSIKRLGKAITGKSDAPGDKDEAGPSGDSTIKDGDGFLYHETEEPRIFVNGEDVPEGWNIENHRLWKYLDSGKCVNVDG